ncbi:hypothetical protein B5807_06326 [Epicoccum nigrum]|uniref:[histone H3]-trimethyl-L-lysine(9) demethylase n=1 Tax=Epicoccum nigrum TaxID=105696 RepID=A0A1Y2LVX9_EPING|nr:hypothetical protein B5807_06326 [Epicoccum nigrum]
MDAPTDVVQSVETPPAPPADDALPKAALTPPTSEDNDPKRGERLSSELSDIDSDDGEDIEPDHYWDGGKIPVFKPTMAQFHNFKRFIDKVDRYGMKSGIVKVIPPTEWRQSLPDLQEAVKSIRVKNPITQEFTGQHGVYTGANVEKQRSYNLPEWRAVTDEPHHQPPAKRGEARAGRKAEAPTRTRSTRAAPKTEDATPAPKRKPGRPARARRAVKKEQHDDEDNDSEILDVPPTPTSPGPEDQKPTRRGGRVKKEDTPTRSRGRQPRAQNEKKSVSSRRLNNRTTVNDYIDEAAFENFDYHMEGIDEFTPERCKELEEAYWKTIWSGQPMYGADMPGSLFDDRTTSWNVAKLPNLLDVLGTKVPGVNTAYLYLGMWKASFAWHLEDVDLYSINYIHFGAPKQWYSISQEDARRFEAAMKSIWPNDAKNCSQFLRHKTYLISPQRLEKDFNIKVNRLVHYEGEFVITYPYGYHSGYNIGYNCAESVNFATESWLSYGRIAKKCDCEPDSVWVDVNEIERKLRGEPTPEYYEETDDDEDDEDGADRLPSPPASVAGKTKKKPGRKPANKRKRGKDESQEAARPKKLRKIRIRLKIPGRGMPCILCPNDVDYDDLLPTDNGMKAHRICADYTPETYILNETVCNVANIGKDRLELKCNYCRSKRGAVFQCSQKKCTRAFHATCAVAAGVQVDLGTMQTFDAEGTEYFYDGYDFRCRFHRPKKRNNKTVDVDALEKNKFILNYGKTLKPRDVIQFQYVGGEMYQIYGAQIVENRPGEQAVLVDVLPDGDRVEVEWKYILKLHPDESQRPKPSANAKPLPEHLKENDASLDITNRTDGVPEMGDSFHDPNSEQKWAEWNTAPEVTQRVAKVEFDKENRLWYYLGKPSTEAKPQYTEDLARPRHNAKSNFLDTVKPPPPAIPTFQRHSYPASYPLKPAPLGMAPRPMMPQQIAPAGGRPYTYKPKDPIVTTWKSPMYNPNNRENPNSPVAHQPNVSYDHRAGPQYAYPPPSPRPLQPQQQQYQPYAPPPHNYSAQGYVAQAASSGPPLGGIDKCAHANQSHQALPSYPYSQSSAQPPRPLPYPGQSTAPYGCPSQQGQAPPLHGGAPFSNMPGTPTGPPKPPIPGGGIAPEWMPKPPQQQAAGTTPMRAGSTGSHGFYHPSPSPHAIAPRPSAQFQSPDAFQRGLTQASSAAAAAAPKWEQMLKQLATSTGAPNSSTPTTATAGPAALAPPPASGPSQQPPQPQYPSLPRASTSYGMPNAPGPFKQHAPPSTPQHLPPPPPQHPQQQPKSEQPARPIPSPISDDGKASGVAAIDPALTGVVPSTMAAAAAAAEGVGSVGAKDGCGKEALRGETWRFSAP